MRSARLTFVLALSLMSPESGQDGPVPPASSGFDEQEALQSLRARIAGREDAPAGEVFQNVKVLAAVPAKRLLAIMQVGYARSLGVSCDHCHVPGDFASDARAPKRIARAMWEMTRELNERMLPVIPDLAGKEPTVNCTTCHRGSRKPALTLDAASAPHAP